MTSKPLFSVIIPTYNRMNIIRGTIDSLLAQSFEDFELLVVDDGSTDGTEEVVRAISDERIIYLTKNNEERAVARNYGARHARGNYINFFDSDDIAYPHHLATARAFIDTHGSPAIFHLHYDIKNSGGGVIRKIPPARNINEQIISGNLLSCNGVFVKREIMLENPFSEMRGLSSLEDWELWIRMASRYEFLSSSQVTSSVIQHGTRSVVTGDPEGIKKKIAAFIGLALSDEKNIEVYGNALRRTSASANTYAALHLAMAKASRREVGRYLLRGVADFPGEMLRKRFLVILKMMLNL